MLYGAPPMRLMIIAATALSLSACCCQRREEKLKAADTIAEGGGELVKGSSGTLELRATPK